MDKQAADCLAMGVVSAMRAIFEAKVAKGLESAEQLSRVLELMQELRPNPTAVAPRKCPGCRHLARALQLADGGPGAPVAAAIRALDPQIAWAQNPRYNADNMGAEFMDNYAWSSLGLVGSEKMSFGVLLLGPGVTYPPTSYESEGVFFVIGGSPEWKSGDDPWKRVQPGAVICRPYGGTEGKRPGNEPMLALYAWMYQ